MQQSGPLFVDGARAFFFRSSRRFSCFFDFANFHSNMAWITLVRIRRTFLRAGEDRAVKDSTTVRFSGRRVMGFELSDYEQPNLRLRSSDGSEASAPRGSHAPAVVPRGAEKTRLQVCVAFNSTKVAAFR